MSTDPVRAALAELADKIEANHIISGSPGPLYSVGWSDANKCSARMIRAALAANSEVAVAPAEPQP